MHRSPVTSELRERISRLRLLVLDFDGVFTDNTVLVSDEGQEFVRCSRADGIGLGMVRELGIEMLVLSTEPNPVVAHRCKKLDVPCLHGCSDKLGQLRRIADERGHDRRAIAYVGNDVNDAECLEWVGLPIAVKDAHPDVLELAGRGYVTRTPGGKGAVREVCELIRAVVREEAH
jgi:3-deoxy-D-manno-octulosonate 8-phosphate phosphatase (KDO 8-P phosphatase)